ncbi:Heme chaperone HemW [Candidatus Xenohaliotis californiensis]|uniref:Heme chaperone HemW n=1 Tax=Candidatus Xenohaliotis californiensis TaxID=84677 RepID=A0ABP0ET55_9RICK|nr:Heme chaperone HemW [Candidatus Xenohaliotis californiensis]
MSLDNISIYVHWPFCASKCPYCSFNSYVSKNIDSDKWILAYSTELKRYKDLLNGKNLQSVFFGGGTPSLAEPRIIGSFLDSLTNYVNFNKNVEITLEANPSTADLNNMFDFRLAGINRVSLGVQSFNDNSLSLLGRNHDVEQAVKMIEIVSDIFENYSFDLIYALPDQEMVEWLADLSMAMNFVAGHLSLYQLSFDSGTKFYKEMLLGRMKPKMDEQSAVMYYTTKCFLESKGFEHYEVSNYSRYGMKCVHNLNYWTYGEYLGIGPGAAGRIKKNGNVYSTLSISSPSKWLDAACCINNNNHTVSSALSIKERAIEFVAMNMRINSGFNFQDFNIKVGGKIDDFVNMPRLELLQSTNFINFDGCAISVAENSRLLTDYITEYIII